jgi:hypothetical protein
MINGSKPDSKEKFIAFTLHSFLHPKPGRIPFFAQNNAMKNFKKGVSAI